MTRQTKAARLRELIAKGAIMLPGVPNAAMARQVERVGFDAVYVSGAGMANSTAGVPDIGLLTLTEVAQLAGYITRAVKIPAIPGLVVPKMSRARSASLKQQIWLVVTLRTRNFRSAADIFPENRWSTLRR